MMIRKKSMVTMLLVLSMSGLVRLFAGNLALVELVKKIASVTWNS